MPSQGVLLQNRYRILRQIGGGGMGVVYLAEDNRLASRRCAIKEMSPAQLAPQDRAWAIPAFQREAQILARLSHPGLTAVTDFFPEGGNWYLVMDYVEGETLKDRLARAPGGRMPLDEALNITRQLCNVLGYLHGQSPPVVFRDLKPGNVMITRRGELKLIDFGIARFFKRGQSQDTVNLGTPGYAAPEQYGGRGQSDPRADVYSLGALLLQMATGYDPAAADTPFPLPAPGDLMRGLPAHVEEVISCATRVQPALRYPSVEEMRQALFPPTWVLPPPGTPQGPQPQLTATRGPGKRVWIVLGFVGALFLGLCVATIVGAGWLSGLLDRPEEQTGHLTATSQALGSTPTSQIAGSTPTPSPVEPTSTPFSADDQDSPMPPSPTLPRIVYVYGSVGDTDVYVAKADGSERECVACRACDEAEPAWSPDESRIVYQSNCGGSYDIWAVSSSGGSPTQLTRTPSADEREPDWSPDGSQIIFRTSSVDSNRNSDGDLQVMDYDGGNVYSLGVRGRSPVWSPDGHHIAFMSERSGSWEVYTYGFQSGITKRLTSCSANCRWPAWSPDGQHVIYHSTTGSGSVTADTIWYVATSGGSSVRLVSGSHAGRPSWCGQGLVAFNSDQGIEVIRADGSGRQTLISGDQNWAPAWSE
jgi:serine/threonine protein kinase